MMTVTRSKAEYQRLAQECLAMARTVSTEEARANLVAMAEVWQRLADQQNEGTDLAEVSAQAPRLDRIQATSTRGVRARIRRMAGCATPTGSAGPLAQRPTLN
jgi:hypothetical protein